MHEIHALPLEMAYSYEIPHVGYFRLPFQLHLCSMSHLKELSAIPAGTTVRIHAVKQEFVGPKLLQMGFLPGSEITVLFKAPFNGPLAVAVDGGMLSLRQNEACLVLTESLEVNV